MTVEEVVIRLDTLWRRDLARRDDEGVSPIVRLAHLGLIMRALDDLVAAVDRERARD